MFDCLIPAAGASSRMRSSGMSGAGAVPKPLLPFGGSTLVETVARAALGAGCRVLVVVGHQGAEVSAPFAAEAYRPAREEGRLIVVENPRWELGQLGSIQAALPSVRSEAFFVALADMPFVGEGAGRARGGRRARGGGLRLARPRAGPSRPPALGLDTRDARPRPPGRDEGLPGGQARRPRRDGGRGVARYRHAGGLRGRA
jgi:CTP:molybdopterin cytidylyltransferase MocA